MHTDWSESGRLVQAQNRPTGPDELCRCGVHWPIRVHLRASAAKTPCLLCRMPLPVAWPTCQMTPSDLATVFTRPQSAHTPPATRYLAGRREDGCGLPGLLAPLRAISDQIALRGARIAEACACDADSTRSESALSFSLFWMQSWQLVFPPACQRKPATRSGTVALSPGFARCAVRFAAVAQPLPCPAPIASHCHEGRQAEAPHAARGRCAESASRAHSPGGSVRLRVPAHRGRVQCRVACRSG
jgi:hypothetical protein